MTSSLLMPDPGEPRTPRTVTPAHVVEPSWLDRVTGVLDMVPGWVWAVALATLTILTVVLLPWARAQAFKAGRRTAGHDKSDAKGTALFIAAMLPAAFFWLAVLAGSFRGLAGFGKDTLGWTDGWEFLVPLTLDGVAISFAFLAFRAVRAERSPQRAIRIVMGAAAASALINYGHEVTHGGSRLGGAYLGLLSVLGMLIFHEFLDQFTEGAAYVQRVNPSFGMRWITWPSNTLCAWIAWRNYPPTPLPADASDAQKMWWGSVNHSVAHLSVVRRAKRIARFAADVADARLSAPWWMRLAPWARVRQLGAALTEQTAATEAQKAEFREIAERLDRVVAEHAQVVAEAERLAEQLAQSEAERDRAEQRSRIAEQTAEGIRSTAAERLEQVRAEAAERLHRQQSEHAQQLASLRSEITPAAARNGRSNVTPFRRSKPVSRTATDDGALADMFAEHPEPDYEWRDREVNRITGAGFSSRAPKLTRLATEHQRTCAAERHDKCFGASRSDNDDAKEEGTGARPLAHATA